MSATLHVEAISCGYALFFDPGLSRKVCVVTVSGHRDLYRDTPAGRHGVQEPIPPDDWIIHWCSPVGSAALVRAVADLLPGLAPCPPPSVEDLRPRK